MRSHRLFTGLGVLLAVAFAPSTARAQADTGRVVTATLLRRLGEVVDGHRTGGNIYVVMSYRFPHAVAAITGNRDSAVVLRQQAGGTYDVFGPYSTQADAPQGAYYAKLPCYKVATTSVIVCPDSSGSGTGGAQLADVLQVVISVKTRDGAVHTQTLTPDRVEAVFFTMASIDKFVIPYYERVLGLAYATDLRARMQHWYVPSH